MSFESLRRAMVEQQLAARGITDLAILDAMATVPREAFVPPELAAYAYDDRPLPIGEGQTISQPYVVAFMTQAVHPRPGERVLEVGTGSGYQAAVLAHLGLEVFSIERYPDLAEAARGQLRTLDFPVAILTGDGTLGWPEHAPFDIIMVTAAAPKPPPPLISQLREGGRLIIPVGDPLMQTLMLYTKTPTGELIEQPLEAVRFVPLVGREGW